LNLLLTSAASSVAQLLASALGDTHKLRLTDLRAKATGEIIANDLDHGGDIDDLLEGIDAIINIGYQGQVGSEKALIDYHTRAMYNLLWSASESGVKRVINVSTLRLFENYEENLAVTEKWRSTPSSQDIELLAAHLTECVCKEFARDRMIQAVNLRFGWPFDSSDKADTARISTDLAVGAVNAALESQELIHWQDIHVQSKVENQRYLTNTAARLLPTLAEKL
tara:strand:+ start:194 stop:865 length:672 start_codon:yes stop_codon:yes gene_type:complete